MGLRRFLLPLPVQREDIRVFLTKARNLGQEQHLLYQNKSLRLPNQPLLSHQIRQLKWLYNKWWIKFWCVGQIMIPMSIILPRSCLSKRIKGTCSWHYQLKWLGLTGLGESTKPSVEIDPYLALMFGSCIKFVYSKTIWVMCTGVAVSTFGLNGKYYCNGVVEFEEYWSHVLIFALLVVFLAV